MKKNFVLCKAIVGPINIDKITWYERDPKLVAAVRINREKSLSSAQWLK